MVVSIGKWKHKQVFEMAPYAQSGRSACRLIALRIGSLFSHACIWKRRRRGKRIVYQPHSPKDLGLGEEGTTARRAEGTTVESQCLFHSEIRRSQLLRTFRRFVDKLRLLGLLSWIGTGLFTHSASKIHMQTEQQSSETACSFC